MNSCNCLSAAPSRFNSPTCSCTGAVFRCQYRMKGQGHVTIVVTTQTTGKNAPERSRSVSARIASKKKPKEYETTETCHTENTLWSATKISKHGTTTKAKGAATATQPKAARAVRRPKPTLRT